MDNSHNEKIVISYQGTKRNGFLPSRFFYQKYYRGLFFCSRARALARAREQKNNPKVIFEVKNGWQNTVSLSPRDELCFSGDWNTKYEVFGFIFRLLRELMYFESKTIVIFNQISLKPANSRYFRWILHFHFQFIHFSLFIFIFIHFFFIILFKWKAKLRKKSKEWVPSILRTSCWIGQLD